MVTLPVGHMPDPALRVLSLPLRSFDAPPAMLGGVAGLPAGALEIASAGLVLAATPCDKPMFRDVLAPACQELGRDVMLVRTGFFPETLDPVTVDVAVTASLSPFVVTDLVFLRHRDGSLWLVPQTSGVYVEVSREGLLLDTMPPFFTWDERCEGVCRAAAEIVRIATRGRVR